MSDLDIDEEPTTPPTYDQIVPPVPGLRKEARKARYLQEDQIAGLMAEVGQLSSLVRESEGPGPSDMRSINGAIGELAEGRAALAELAARRGRTASTKRRSRGCTETVEATRTEPGPDAGEVGGSMIARGGHRVLGFWRRLSTGSEAEMDTRWLRLWTMRATVLLVVGW